MRLTVFALIAAFVLITVPAAGRAAPVIGGDPAITAPAPIVEVRGGCGPG